MESGQKRIESYPDSISGNGEIVLLDQPSHRKNKYKFRQNVKRNYLIELESDQNQAHSSQRYQGPEGQGKTEEQFQIERILKRQGD